MVALTGQVAVITGASSGVGKAIALALASQGATLCLLGRDSEKLELVAEAARSDAHAVRCYESDLLLDQEIRDIAGRLHDDFGYVDILIHSAGVISLGGFESAPAEEFDRQYRINVRAPYALTQMLLPMLRSRQGQIVFINSSLGMRSKADAGQYAATKHGLKALADALRDEVNPDGLRVLSVFLGRTATPMQAAVHKMEERTYYPEYFLQPEDVASMVVNTLSLPRTAEVTEISIRPLKKN